jgi:hypothetical protein
MQGYLNSTLTVRAVPFKEQKLRHFGLTRCLMISRNIPTSRSFQLLLLRIRNAGGLDYQIHNVGLGLCVIGLCGIPKVETLEMLSFAKALSACLTSVEMGVR